MAIANGTGRGQLMRQRIAPTRRSASSHCASVNQRASTHARIATTSRARLSAWRASVASS
jgi:hypothetical protein